MQVDLTSPNEVLTRSDGTQFTDVKEQGLLGSDKPLIGSTQRITVTDDVDMYTFAAPDDGTLQADTEAQSVYGSGRRGHVRQGVRRRPQPDRPERRQVRRQHRQPGQPRASSAARSYYVAVTVFDNRGFDPNDPYNSRTPNSTPADAAYDLHLSLDTGDADGTPSPRRSRRSARP